MGYNGITGNGWVGMGEFKGDCSDYTGEMGYIDIIYYGELVGGNGGGKRITIFDTGISWAEMGGGGEFGSGEGRN